jgi:hypothetical protein
VPGRNPILHDQESLWLANHQMSPQRYAQYSVRAPADNNGWNRADQHADVQ